MSAAPRRTDQPRRDCVAGLRRDRQHHSREPLIPQGLIEVTHRCPLPGGSICTRVREVRRVRDETAGVGSGQQDEDLRAMDDNDYREILNHIRVRARESGLTDLDALTVAGFDEERSAEPRATLQRYLAVLRESAVLRSSQLEERILALIRDALAPDSLPIEGFEVVADERVRASFGLDERVPLRGNADLSRTVERIERLERIVAEGEAEGEAETEWQ